MNELERELQLSKYLEEWVNNHFGDWNLFYYDVVQNQANGIRLLKDSDRLIDLLVQIHSTIEERFSLPNKNSHLIPTQFASVSHLLRFLEWEKEYIGTFKPSIKKNIADGVIDNYIISGICDMVSQFDEMVDRRLKVYKNDDLPQPYQLLREKLFNKDIDGFIELVSGILRGVPYLSRKKAFDEGHFQTMLQILLTVLGFEPFVEKPQSDGRIDMVVRMGELTYVFEFKYTRSKSSQAKKALQQIKDKGYADQFKPLSKEIIGVGVSFSQLTKNINGKEYKTLYVRGA